MRPCGNNAHYTGRWEVFGGALWLAFDCVNHGRIWVLEAGIGEPVQGELALFNAERRKAAKAAAPKAKQLSMV